VQSEEIERMTNQSTLRVKNWTRFQHYKNRRPPWIKLHADLLNNRDWHTITGDDAKLLVELWLVAADLSDDGTIPLSMLDLAFRLRRDSKALAKSLKSLCDTGFLRCASTALADAAPETEAETEAETEVRTSAKKRPTYTSDFQQLWDVCKRGSRKQAFDQYHKARASKGIAHDLLLAKWKAHVQAASEPEYVAHLFRWLRDERWEEDAHVSANGNGKRTDVSWLDGLK
jgi:hypothetical protein